MSNHNVKTSPQFYARITGLMFLLYIALAIASMVLFNQATSGVKVSAAPLAGLATVGG